MLGRDELKEYAKRVCIPLMERTAARALKRELAFQADSNGYIPSFLENFCRPFWGISPLLADGEEILLSVEGKEVTVFQYMKEILLRGLSHGREESWDIYKQYLNPYSFENQCITELAGLAVGLYFAKEQLWEPFSEREKNTLAGELYQMAETAFDHSWPNNHYWFPLLTLTVLKKLGFVFDRTDTILEDGLAILDGLYMEDGWYQDGEFGRFDYYEAWSLHLYPLLWTLIADESFKGYCRRKEQYLSRTEQFLEFYCYWFVCWPVVNLPDRQPITRRLLWYTEISTIIRWRSFRVK